MDPFLVSIIGKRLESIAREMTRVLERTARSPLLQIRDFSTGILDGSRAILCQEEGLPLMTYGYSTMLAYLEDAFGSDIGPGDIFIANDPFHGNNQAQDTAVLQPVFVDGALHFWAAAKGHLADWGGAVLGGYNPDAVDVWQETIRIPPLRVVEGGRLRRDVWRFLLANSRLPELVGGDLQALLGSCRIGTTRLQELWARYGDELPDLVAALLDSSHRRMQHEVRQMPDGVYTAEAAWKLPTGLERKESVCRLTATIEDDSIHLDFTGSDPQCSRYYNGVYATTYASALSTFLMLVDPEIPHNEGVERCIKVTIPEGSFLNATFPAPTVMGNFVMNDVVAEALMKALAPALPDRVCAGWARGLNANFAGMRDGKPFIGLPLMSNKGGAGAVAGADGWSCIGNINCGGGFAFDDYEVFETAHPVRLLEHEYLEGSAGAGEWRGGFGIRMRYRIDSASTVTSFGDDVDEAYGLLGGLRGRPNGLWIEHPDGRAEKLPGNAFVAAPAGSVVEVENGGGGGFGEPRRRPAVLVREEVRDGLLSPEEAERVYGVAWSATG